MLTRSPSAGWYFLLLVSALFLVASVFRYREFGPAKDSESPAI